MLFDIVKLNEYLLHTDLTGIPLTRFESRYSLLTTKYMRIVVK